MKQLALLFTLFSISVFGQMQRFIYDYAFALDPDSTSTFQHEQMMLDVTKNASKFYSYTVYHSDSLMRVDLENQLRATGSINVRSDMRKGKVRYSVLKTYPDYQVDFLNRIFADSYSVREDRKLNWKILPDKEKIGEWEAQKAETDFAGRKWTAWFAQEIPIQDGPYKFYGLPGLIVKLEDQTKTHNFELKGIQNIQNKTFEDDVFKTGKRVAITRKQYEKIRKEYEADPTKGMRQLSMSGVVMKMEGNDADTQKMMKEREQRLKATLKKESNTIELE